MLSAPSYVTFDRIDLGDDTSTRAKLNEDAVARYRERYKVGGEMPAPILFTEGDHVFYVGDGRHRITAQMQNGLEGCPCDVRRGSKWDAIAFAAQSDLDSAVPRTTEDRGRAVDLMLRDPIRNSWTDGKIARLCGVSDVTVGNHRKKLIKAGKVEPSPVRIGKGGRKLDTTKIGAKKRHAARPTPKASESNGPAPRPATARPAPHRESSEAGEETNIPTPKPSESEVLDSYRPTTDPATPANKSDRSAQPASSADESDHIDQTVAPDPVAFEAEMERLRQKVASLEKERESLGVLFHELGVSNVEAALHAVRELKSSVA